ncbi:MAG TPA: hypothetical protein VMW78_00480 [Anaerolineae bacterium]|nr:hypothetical protein [Anaerolineae bacterium]
MSKKNTIQAGLLEMKLIYQYPPELKEQPFLDKGACPAVKNIGKPCAGKPHARFDEGGLSKVATARLLRHCQTKRAETDMPNLRSQQPALYSAKSPHKSPVFSLLSNVCI